MDGTPHYRGGCTSPPSFIRRGRFDFLPSASTFSAAQLLILAVAASTNHEQIDLNEQDT